MKKYIIDIGIYYQVLYNFFHIKFIMFKGLIVDDGNTFDDGKVSEGLYN